MRLGQGIVFGDRYANTISALSTQSPIVSSDKIAPYTSFTEQWYLHGLTFTGKIANFRFSPYYSKSKLDINLKNDSISSFDESGYHDKSSPTTNLEILGLYSSGQPTTWELATILPISALANHFTTTKKLKNIKHTLWISATNWATQSISVNTPKLTIKPPNSLV